VLDGLARGEVVTQAAEPKLRPGTVLMREHGGARYTVTVAADGFIYPLPAVRNALRTARA
jgi:hypothetical protein